VPTLQALTGQPFDLVAWFMVYAPAATPAPVLARLRTATREALAAPETQARLTAQGLEGINAHGEDLAAFGVRETGKWGELVRQSGAQVD
jgi:tripartite-type tricarboxylate transporter receptor subunit TctC